MGHSTDSKTPESKTSSLSSNTTPSGSTPSPFSSSASPSVQLSEPVSSSKSAASKSAAGSATTAKKADVPGVAQKSTHPKKDKSIGAGLTRAPPSTKSSYSGRVTLTDDIAAIVCAASSPQTQNGIESLRHARKLCSESAILLFKLRLSIREFRKGRQPRVTSSLSLGSTVPLHTFLETNGGLKEALSVAGYIVKLDQPCFLLVRSQIKSSEAKWLLITWFPKKLADDPDPALRFHVALARAELSQYILDSTMVTQCLCETRSMIGSLYTRDNTADGVRLKSTTKARAITGSSDEEEETLVKKRPLQQAFPDARLGASQALNQAIRTFKDKRNVVVILDVVDEKKEVTGNIVAGKKEDVLASFLRDTSPHYALIRHTDRSGRFPERILFLMLRGELHFPTPSLLYALCKMPVLRLLIENYDLPIAKTMDVQRVSDLGDLEGPGLEMYYPQLIQQSQQKDLNLSCSAPNVTGASTAEILERPRPISKGVEELFSFPSYHFQKDQQPQYTVLPAKDRFTF